MIPVPGGVRLSGYMRTGCKPLRRHIPQSWDSWRPPLTKGDARKGVGTEPPGDTWARQPSAAARSPGPLVPVTQRGIPAPAGLGSWPEGSITNRQDTGCGGGGGHKLGRKGAWRRTGVLSKLGELAALHPVSGEREAQPRGGAQAGGPASNSGAADLGAGRGWW